MNDATRTHRAALWNVVRCCALAFFVAAPSAAADRNLDGESGRYSASGRVVVLDDHGARRLALEGPDGQVSHYFSPASTVDVERFVGQRVGVEGPLLLVGSDEAFVVRAERVDSLDAATGVRRANFATPLSGGFDPYVAAHGADGFQLATWFGSGPRSSCGSPGTNSCPPPTIVSPMQTSPALLNPPVMSPRDNAFFAEQVRYGDHFWAYHDYLGWWVKGDRVPPLVTSATPGTPVATAGVLGEPTTGVLFGDQRVNDGFRSGARITIGGWVTPFTTGIEGNYYSFLRERTDFAESSYSSEAPNTQILARPFFNTLNGQQDAFIVAYPLGVPVLFDFMDGRVHVHANSDVQSAGATLKQLITLWYPPNYRLYVVGGYRFFRLDEGLLIQSVNIAAGGIFNGVTVTLADNFATSNQFHGGDIGLSGEWHVGRYSFAGVTKVAIGNMNETVMIDGSHEVVDPVLMTTTSGPGGLLAQPTNIGRFTKNELAIIPEVELKLGYQLTPKLRATAGYNFTYVSKVVRPGSEIDLAVNPTQLVGLPLVGEARPAPRLDSTSLWLQGVTAGVEARF